MSGNNDDNAETIRIRAEVCQQIVEDTVSGKITVRDALDRLKDQAGATPAETRTYLQQITERMDPERRNGNGDGGERSGAPAGIQREPTPVGLEENELAEFRKRRDAELAAAQERLDEQRARDAITQVEWAKLRADFAAALAGDLRPRSSTGTSHLSSLLGLLDGANSGPIPASVLKIAPHLSELTTPSNDSHIRRTWELRQAFGLEKVADNLIDVMQQQNIDASVGRSLWRDIILDRYVSFEKLYASMDPSYSVQDEPKEFSEGFAIIKKEHVSAKSPIRGEGDWSRVFAVWQAAVLLLYPHRKDELTEYRRIVMEIFIAFPDNPNAAIRFDADVRSQYGNNPFRMDERSRLNIPLLMRVVGRTASSGPSKRPSSSSTSSSKRAETICINWNGGYCEEPCPGRRKHGYCCECGGKHRAVDEPACKAQLEARRRKRASDGYRASGSSGGRT
jgi:hypothetical protein